MLDLGLFFDNPTRHGVELNGRDVIWDFTRYLFDNPHLAFIVFRHYSCEGITSSRPEHSYFRKSLSEDANKHKILPDDDFIYIVSSSLRSALYEVGECNPFDGDKEDEMRFPYIFIYHHRSRLRDLVNKREGETSLHVSALLSYIEDQNRTEYEDADAQIAKRLVTAEHLRKLYKPNQTLVTHEKGHPTAFILRSWPDGLTIDSSDHKGVELSGWSWKHNGKALVRYHHSRKASIAGHEEVAIDQLAAFPLEFASREVKTRLITRGGKFWNLRAQSLMAYSGQDFYKEKKYVTSP